MDKIMNKLADLILKEIAKRDCSCAYFADVCGISVSEIYYILSRKNSDMRLSTLIKICNNSGIFITDVLDCSILDAQKDIADNAIIVIHGVEYRLTKSNLLRACLKTAIDSSICQNRRKNHRKIRNIFSFP